MKKTLLIISLFLSLFNVNNNVGVSNYSSINLSFFNTDINISQEEKEESIVTILNNENNIIGNGLIFDFSANETFIMTSCLVSKEEINKEIIFNNYIRASLNYVGSDENQCISVFKTSRIEGSKIKYGNSDLLVRAQTANILTVTEATDFLKSESSGLIANIGVMNENNNFKKRFNSILNLKTEVDYFGVPVYDQIGQVVGITTHTVTKTEQDLIERMIYFVNINEALLIAKKIKEDSHYIKNQFKFKTISLESLSISQRKYYGVYEKQNSGVVVLSEYFFRYIFGGLNKGMIITQINGVDVQNEYDIHKQLLRYNKNSIVMLKLINKRGKVTFQKVKI